MNPLIINVALTGVIPSKNMTTHVPITPKEIANDAESVYKLGAQIVHIHARNYDGYQTHNKSKYEEIIDRIKQKCPDLIISVSTTGRHVQDFDLRSEVLDIDPAPDMASITMGSMNFMQGASLNSPEWLTYLMNKLINKGILPEIEIFHDGMINYTKYFIRKGLLPKKNYVNLFLGNVGTTPADLLHLSHLISDLPTDTIWAASGIGRFALEITALAIMLGGGVRVGIEDSIYMDRDKKELATNPLLVERAVLLADSYKRSIATIKETRQFLNI